MGCRWSNGWLVETVAVTVFRALIIILCCFGLAHVFVHQTSLHPESLWSFLVILWCYGLLRPKFHVPFPACKSLALLVLLHGTTCTCPALCEFLLVENSWEVDTLPLHIVKALIIILCCFGLAHVFVHQTSLHPESLWSFLVVLWCYGLLRPKFHVPFPACKSLALLVLLHGTICTCPALCEFLLVENSWEVDTLPLHIVKALIIILCCFGLAHVFVHQTSLHPESLWCFLVILWCYELLRPKLHVPFPACKSLALLVLLHGTICTCPALCEFLLVENSWEVDTLPLHSF